MTLFSGGGRVEGGCLRPSRDMGSRAGLVGVEADILSFRRLASNCAWTRFRQSIGAFHTCCCGSF